MGRDVPVSAGSWPARTLGAVALGLLLSGCGWTGPMNAQTWSDVAAGPDVITLDKAAYKLVAVQNKSTERLQDGRLEVRLELANLSSKDLPVQVQTLYRDEAGVLLDDATPFEMIVLPGNGSKLYKATSLKAAAASYTVQIKTP